MKKTLNQLKRILDGKTTYIWGASIVGQGICKALERCKLPVHAFIDSSNAFRGKKALGYTIESPTTVQLTKHKNQQVVIIASGHFDLEIEQVCKDAGLKKDRHYIMANELNDVDPSVDISGTCNLKCISCPKGNMDKHPSIGFMSLSEYKPILAKLLNELPFLGSVQLYAWGEPMLNSDLPEIVAYTKTKHILTALSTNLNISKGYEAVIKAGIDWFKISASGYGESYEVTHTGGKWPIFLENLRKVVALRDSFRPEMQIILNYHLYKHNIGKDYYKMKSLCEELNIIFRPSPAYLYPLENIRDYIDGKPLSKKSLATIDLLLMDLNEGLQKAYSKRSNRCPEERCLPISWNQKVRFCGVYYNPFICDNFLDTPIEDIIQKRLQSDFCRECKQRGLHQFTGVYLAEKYLEEE